MLGQGVTTLQCHPATRPRAAFTGSAGLGSTPGLLHQLVVWCDVNKGDPRTEAEEPPHPKPQVPTSPSALTRVVRKLSPVPQLF